MAQSTRAQLINQAGNDEFHQNLIDSTLVISTDLPNGSLSSISTALVAKKDEDESKSGTSFANDDDLAISNIPIGLYRIKIVIWHNAGLTTGLKFKMIATSGVLSMKICNNLVLSAFNILGDTLTLAGAGASPGGDRGVIYEGVVEVTSIATLQMQWAQTINTSNTTVYKNSFIQLVKL